MSTPLKTTGTDGDIEQFTVAEQNYLAYQAGIHLSKAGINDPAGLDFNAGGTTVGTYVNTLMDQEIGAHASLTSSSTTNIVLYQNTGTAVETGPNFRRPLEWNVSLGGLKEMPDASLNTLVDRLLGTVFANDYPGTYKLASSTPAGGYTQKIANMFTDTRTDGTTIDYHIYRRTSMTAPAVHKAIGVKRSGATFSGLQVLSEAESEYTFGQRMQTRITDTGIGTYQLRSATAGVPSAPGTWVAKGVALDTRQAVGDTNFTGDYAGNYTGDYAGATILGSTTTIETFTLYVRTA